VKKSHATDAVQAKIAAPTKNEKSSEKRVDF